MWSRLTLTQKGIFLLVNAEMHSPVSVSHSLQKRSYEHLVRGRGRVGVRVRGGVSGWG